MTMKILVTDDVSPKGVELLKSQGFEVDVTPNLSEEEFIKVIPPYDAFIMRSLTKVTAAGMDAGKKLKALGRAGAGVDHIDIKAATERGIVVCNTPDSNTMAATEHTCAMLLATTRHIPQAHNSLMSGEWNRKKYTGVQLQNKTLGIIGVGRIGSRVAKRMQAFEMRTIGYDPYISKERARQLGVELVDLDTLLKESDFITLHTPLTQETRGMIGPNEFAKMKEGVRVVNVARGPVLDVEALAENIKSGHVADAAVDVFPNEPVTLDNNPFLGLDRIIITPHMGANTEEAQLAVSIDAAQGVIDALNGQPVATAVNMAPIPKAVYEKIEPYFGLVERMGFLGTYIADGALKEITVEYNGELVDTETEMLTTTAVKGVLSPILQETVNFVNARNIATARDIEVKEVKSQGNKPVANAVTLTLKTEKNTHTIVGTLFNGNEAKIIQIDDYRMDFTPEGYLLLAPHNNRPNMIGQISTILGEAGINITGMQVGKTTDTDTNIMAVAVQADISNDIMIKLRAIEGILEVKLINCEAGH